VLTVSGEFQHAGAGDGLDGGFKNFKSTVLSQVMGHLNVSAQPLIAIPSLATNFHFDPRPLVWIATVLQKSSQQNRPLNKCSLFFECEI